MFRDDLVLVKDLSEDIEEEALHEFVGSGQAIEAAYSKYSGLDLTCIVFEEVVYKKTELFEDGIDVWDCLEDLFMVIAFEWFVDIEVYISSIRIQSLRILINQLLESLKQYIFRFLLLLQQINDHNSPKFRFDIIEMLEKWQGSELFIPC